MTYPPVHVVHSQTNGKAPSFPFDIFDISITDDFPAHRHDCLEFFLIVGGSGLQIINGDKFPLQRGTCTFLLPYQVHELHAHPNDPLQLYNCMFDMELLTPFTDFDTGLNELLFHKPELPPTMQLNDEYYNHISPIMELMLKEFSQQNPWRKQLLQLKLAEMILFFNRLRLEHTVQPQQNIIQGHRSIWPIVQYIHSHYREPLSLSQLAMKFNINHTNLSTEFKKQLGLNFVHFLQEVRIRHACALLSTTDLNGVDIAIEVGFDSFRSFSRVFRELKGITPKQYQVQYQSPNQANKQKASN